MPSGVYKRTKKHKKYWFKKGYTPWNKGKKCPQLSKPRNNNYWLGKHHSKKTIKKISETHKGENNPMYGKHHSEESKKKSRLAHLGKKASKATRRKISKARLKYMAKYQNIRKTTSIEKKVYNELKRRGLLFEKQKLINNKFLVDVYIPKLNLVIEADGDYWHSLPKVIKKDKAENAYLIKCGFDLLRLTETEINSRKFISKLPN